MSACGELALRHSCEPLALPAVPPVIPRVSPTPQPTMGTREERKAEQRLKELLKEPANKRCINCESLVRRGGRRGGVGGAKRAPG